MRDQCSPVSAQGIIQCGIWASNKSICLPFSLLDFSVLHQNPTEANGEALIDFGKVWIPSWFSFSFLLLSLFLGSLTQKELESFIRRGKGAAFQGVPKPAVLARIFSKGDLIRKHEGSSQKQRWICLISSFSISPSLGWLMLVRLTRCAYQRLLNGGQGFGMWWWWQQNAVGCGGRQITAFKQEKLFGWRICL